MIIVNFEQEFPDNFRRYAENLIREFEILLPIWVQEVAVCWIEEDGVNASMNLDEDYRRLMLNIGRNLFDRPLRYQREVIIHEFCHCFNSPIGDIANEILDMMIPEGDESPTESVRQLYGLLFDKIGSVVERVNTDFAYSVSRLIDSLKKEK